MLLTNYDRHLSMSGSKNGERALSWLRLFGVAMKYFELENLCVRPSNQCYRYQGNSLNFSVLSYVSQLRYHDNADSLRFSEIRRLIR